MNNCCINGFDYLNYIELLYMIIGCVLYLFFLDVKLNLDIVVSNLFWVEKLFFGEILCICEKLILCFLFYLWWNNVIFFVVLILNNELGDVLIVGY